ncbi:uncharacterized protein LOC122928684 [Bufo gargarizans]|uniref:uncharacterized protein LOC122928684 n=1 Tax=Bufo gargarizans TaxID=30331 RepID=UPI001CF46CA4|nr:uncharacterized protein LOC122928684 [Bufo gargarizans]
MSRMAFIFLVFLHLSGMALGEICITQDPVLNVSYLDIARISCHWNSDKGQQFRIVWRKHISSPGEENGTELCSVLRTENSSNSEVRSKITCNATNNSSLLTIHGVTKDDGGKYVCEVTREIPTLKKGRGDGTQLYVQDDIRGQPKHMNLVGAIAILPFVALTAYFLCKRKKRTPKKIPQNRSQEHVELNQMQPNAAKAEEDSSSSTNSVQWAVSTLYESFDYFAMKNPDDKAATPSTSHLAEPETTEESDLTAM